MTKKVFSWYQNLLLNLFLFFHQQPNPVNSRFEHSNQRSSVSLAEWKTFYRPEFTIFRKNLRFFQKYDQKSFFLMSKSSFKPISFFLQQPNPVNIRFEHSNQRSNVSLTDLKVFFTKLDLPDKSGKLFFLS